MHVPVWYELTKAWVESGRLVLIGITQEQHPDRCRLFRQWKQLDMPILWDPFNLTESAVVPNFVAIDEHGVVRSTRPDPARFEAEFLDVEFAAPEPTDPAPLRACGYGDPHGAPDPIAQLLRGEHVEQATDGLVALAAEAPDSARAAFRAGVALRLRYDSPARREADFQGALDHWGRALALEPNQYIWRRRIQQYGPRMDKPYPFYVWVDDAVRELRARGEPPVELTAELTAAELAQPRKSAQAEPTAPAEPDPEARVQRDVAGWVGIDPAVAPDTSGSPWVSVHLEFLPDSSRDVHWNHEAGSALEVWVGGPTPRLLSAGLRSDVATTTQALRVNFELDRNAQAGAARLPCHALYYVCEGVGGTCRYLRQDFELVLERP